YRSYCVRTAIREGIRCATELHHRKQPPPPINTAAVANNLPPPINTADPYMFPPEAPSSLSSYSPLGYYGLMFDVDPIVAAYNNMPDHPNKPPKSWLENIEWERKSLVARAQAMGWRNSYTSQQQEEEHGEGEEQPTKKPRFCAIPYVQPSPEVPWISVRDFTKEEREFTTRRSSRVMVLIVLMFLLRFLSLVSLSQLRLEIFLM
ncbi:hypothetical protein C3L33_17813, partial [Rhododendron williamsianum]